MNDLIILKSQILPIKVASTREEQAKGLMGVINPPIMVFPGKTDLKRFWMKDTPSHLDVVFCKNGFVIEIFDGIPFSEKEFGPQQKCNLVVEIPKKISNNLNIKSGDYINIKYSMETLAKIFSNKYYDIDYK